jgi:hypothetical protein
MLTFGRGVMKAKGERNAVEKKRTTREQQKIPSYGVEEASFCQKIPRIRPLVLLVGEI